MDIKIFQVNMERDTNNVAYMGMDLLEARQKSTEIDSGIYDSVYSGTVDCKNLEDVFEMFNTNPPEDYRARSLSVSDVVQVGDTLLPWGRCDIVLTSTEFECSNSLVWGFAPLIPR